MSGATGWAVSWNPAGLSWAIKTLSKQILSPQCLRRRKTQWRGDGATPDDGGGGAVLSELGWGGGGPKG